MLRRLHSEQPESFAFTPANQEWAEAQITKYPDGRAQSAVIPLLWRAQEQEGWLTRPAIEHVADMLGMAHIRALEVASFYFMFQLQPVGTVAHLQICGTTSCMICGAEDLVAVCQAKIAPNPHQLSEDGKFSWEEVECLGSCSNAPMAQIGKDYYEDLTAARLEKIIDAMGRGEVPLPGPQNGRYAAEPKGGLTSLTEFDVNRADYNASVQRAHDIGDTVKRIDGTEVPLLAPWGRAQPTSVDAPAPEPAAKELTQKEVEAEERRKKALKAVVEREAARRAAKAGATGEAEKAAAPVVDPKDAGNRDYDGDGVLEGENEGTRPAGLEGPRGGKADDLKEIKGVGPAMERLCNELGFYHFDQIAAWTPNEVAWVDANLKGFRGRVSRDGWVDQAKILAAGGETEFSKKVQDGGVY